MDTLVEKLKELGFNSYEGKVYIALLKKQPATGYEISQLANIPQSRAYDALKTLLAENIVSCTNEKPQRYIPITPKELTLRFKRKINSTIDYLEKKLPSVKEDYNEPINTIFEYNKIIEKLKEVINNAEISLYIEIWSIDYKQIEKELSAAYDRGVKIKIVGYDDLNSMYGLVYNHDGGKELEYTIGSRMIFLLADSEESVFGRIDIRVIWTKNEDISFMLKEFIVHDMYLLDVYARFPEQLKYFYGIGFKKLKDKILDKKSSYDKE
jgi:sugar-specific transcriptional regulator TrmB